MSAQYIMMKNQDKKLLLKSIRKHAPKFKSDLRHKNKFKKIAYKRLKTELYRYLEEKQRTKSIKNALKNEIYRYFQRKRTN